VGRGRGGKEGEGEKKGKWVTQLSSGAAFITYSQTEQPGRKEKGKKKKKKRGRGC